MKKFWRLIRCEYWEHRSLWRVPAITTLILWGIWASFYLAKVPLFRFNITSGSAGELSIFPIFYITSLTFFALFALLFLTSIFYSSAALFNDRKDRSILFWKALPISDRKMVYAKWLVALFEIFVAGLLAWLVGWTIVLLSALIYPDVITNVWDMTGDIFDWAKSFWFVTKLSILTTIIALPWLSWTLLVSAFSPRNPLLLAIIVPVFLSIIVGWIAPDFFVAHFGSPFLFGWTSWFPGFMPGASAGVAPDIYEYILQIPLLDIATKPVTWYYVLTSFILIELSVGCRKRINQ